ncbi:MAG: hypothetical protein NC094_02730 [Bacteroidales bacterium]|nr:hypothetical protein [Lachnoclostridium sp.]MCM1383465.1 hypothetical protein [Lachnoclostridium sp.]MCM1464314.1 hypothetical protein [Bacteroidales bacterium]
MKAKAWLTLAVAVLCMVCATGCSGNSLRELDDAVMKEIAADALKEKYGEEFIIHKAVKEYNQTFFVTCSPKSQEEVVFEAWIDRRQNKDGEEKGRVGRDNYDEGKVSVQISKELEEEMQEIFPDCYVHVVAFGFAILNGDEIRELTLHKFMEEYVLDYDGEYDPTDLEAGFLQVLVQVHVKEENLQNADLEAEYQYFSEEILGSLDDGWFPEMNVWIYPVDSEEQEWCREYFKTNYQGWQDYYDKIESDKKLCLKCFFNREFAWTYEEYAALRRGEK